MINPTYTEFLSTSIKDSIYTAGVCAIFKIADPKAAAVGTLITIVARKCLVQISKAIIPTQSSVIALSFLGAFLILPIMAGTYAGQKFDKRFNYMDMSFSYAITSITTGFIAYAFGIKNPV